MKKKNILVVLDTYDNKLNFKLNYINFLKSLDFKISLVIPSEFDFQELDNYDALLMSGGADINPSRYGQAPSIFTQRLNPNLEWVDENIVPHFIEKDKLIICICRGLQSMNVIMGGTLHQNITGHEKSTHDCKVTNIFLSKLDNKKPLRKFMVRKLIKLMNEQLIEVTKESISYTVKTNSYHHQCIDVLGDNLIPVLTSLVNKDSISNNIIKDKLIVESFVHQTKPIVGFQFHPEEDSDDSYNFAKFLIEHVQNRK